MTNEEWASIARAVGLELLGEPKSETSKEIRWGNKGSVCLNVETGQFYDFEADKGYGVHGLLTEYDVDVAETLKRFGFSDEVDSLKVVNKYSPKTTSSLNRQQMAQLWQEAIIKVKYSDNFLVLRFPDGHYKSYQKYAPYCKQPDGSWVCKRPDGKLPLYVTPDRSKEHPVLLVEGEKAAMAAEHIYEHQVVCHHGGCKGWEKTDWSPIFGRDVYIFPDKDEAGIQFAYDISRYLTKNGCTVSIARPPEELQEKDDLHEARERELFRSSADLVHYIQNAPLQRPKGTLYFERADQVITQVTKPDWLIKTIAEKQSLMGIFGKPKEGKSFVALDMAVAIAKGTEYFGYEAFKAPVVMLVGEGKRGVTRRLAAIEQGRTTLADAPLYLSSRGTRVLDEDEYAKLIEELDIIAEKEGSIGCIIFDTLNRNFGAGSENSTEDMTLFISRVDNLIHKYAACVVIVHHTGHGNTGRQRGSSVLGASMDYEFKVTREDSGGDMYVTVEQTLNKDGQGMANLDFKFNEVELLGFDDLTSGFLELTTQKPVTAKSMNKAHAEVDKALKRLATLRAVDNNCEPEDCWFGLQDIYGQPDQVNGQNKMSEANVRKYLKQMIDTEMVNYDSDKNMYQSIEYKEKVDYNIYA